MRCGTVVAIACVWLAIAHGVAAVDISKPSHVLAEAGAEAKVGSGWRTGDWGSCSATCGWGTKTRGYWCDCIWGRCDNGNCHTWNGSPPSTSTSCYAGTDCYTYSWYAGDYSSCSVLCGSGTQTRSVYCRNDQTGGTVADSYCSGTKPASSTTCNAGTCGLEYGEWGSCSATCGTGVQTRSASCVNAVSKAVVATALCTETPSTSRTCNNTDECYSWSYGTWSDCSTTCGDGIKTRSVSCVSTSGAVDSTGDKCVNAGSRPASVETCFQRICTVWQAGYWSDCAATCGDSVTTRTVTCVRTDTQVTVASDLCSSEDQPATTTPCYLCECPSYEWQYGEYGACSVTCGTGSQTRSATCLQQPRGLEVEYSLCQQKVGSPSVEETCTKSACPLPAWATGAWGECDASCGTGTKSRSVWCEFNGKVVDSSQCKDAAPDTSISCEAGVCEEWSYTVSSWSECVAAEYGGEAECGGYQLRDVRCMSNLRGYVSLIECAVNNAGEAPDDKNYCYDECPDIVTVGEWSKCSATCGDGFQTRTVTCTNYAGVPKECESNAYATIGMCNAGVCPVYFWNATEYSECSASCGLGAKTRTVWCESSLGGVVDASMCEGSGTALVTVTECSGVPCASWSTEEWSCSVTCGVGTATRSVSCVADGTTDVVSPTYCVSTAPISQKSCDTGVECKEPYWTTGEWSDCSSSCGAGVSTTSVRCVNALNGRELEDSECASVEVPATSRDCNYGPCDSYEWSEGEWGDCSVSCGVGLQERSVFCASQLLGTAVSDTLCAGDKPISSRVCSITACAYSWFACEWGDCSVTCGFGAAERDVYCADYAGFEVEDSFCADIVKPISTRECAMAACGGTAFWTRGGWGECSVTCGSGSQSRAVTCVNAAGVTIADSFCSGEKPLTVAACFKDDC